MPIFEPPTFRSVTCALSTQLHPLLSYYSKSIIKVIMTMMVIMAIKVIIAIKVIVILMVIMVFMVIYFICCTPKTGFNHS
jgi:hypothetical protein